MRRNDMEKLIKEHLEAEKAGARSGRHRLVPAKGSCAIQRHRRMHGTTGGAPARRRGLSEDSRLVRGLTMAGPPHCRHVVCRSCRQIANCPVGRI